MKTLMEKMMKNSAAFSLTLAVALLGAVGCDEGTDGSAYTDVEKNVPADTGHEDHADEGIHGGDIVEVGDTHAYHAEIAFDKESRNIDVYFYGATIGTALPVSTEGFEFEIEGEDGEESELAAEAVPAEGETAEMASHFLIRGDAIPATVTSEEQLHVHFHVVIDGNEYSAGLEPHEHGEVHPDGDDDKDNEQTGEPDTDEAK